MTLPNFLIIGAAKSGTTALYQYLQQHPQIYFSPIKEPKFFAYDGAPPDYRGPAGDETRQRDFVTELAAYEALFAGVTGQTAIGEASTLYLYHPRAPERIRHHIPGAKLIAVLRHPVDRAYSDFLSHTVVAGDGREPLADFGEALQAEAGRIRDNWWPLWHYQQRGFYHGQLARYYERFPRSQIKVYLYEDLESDAAGLCRDVFRFLGVDDEVRPDTSLKHNVSGLPRNQRLHDLLTKPHPLKKILKPLLPDQLRQRLVTRLRSGNLVRPPLPVELRRQLLREYRPDILRLQELIQRDLSNWLKEP